MVSQEEADRIMKIEGNTRGMVLNVYYDHLLKEKGKQGLKEVEERLRDLGYTFEFKRFSHFQWHRESLVCLVSLVAHGVLEWDESKAFEVGYDAPVRSTFIRLLIQRFFTIGNACKNIQSYWRRISDFGEMKCKLDLEKRNIVIKLYNFKKFHPIVHNFMKGILVRITEILTRKEVRKAEFRKCIFNGDAYDELEIAWE